MLRMFPYVFKSLGRNRTRTLLTLSGSAVALLVYCIISAIWTGFEFSSLGRQGDRTLIVFQANRFCPATSRLQEDYQRTIASIPGVKQVVPIQVFTNNCRASLDVIVFHGISPEKLKLIRNLRIIEGNWQSFENRNDGALVGRSVAQRRNLSVGDTFTIDRVKVYVSGIFASEVLAEENMIYTHLLFLQQTPGLDAVGTVTQFEVVLSENANVEDIGRQIDDHFRGGPVPTDTRAKNQFQASTLGDLIELIGLLRYLGYACLALVLGLVATTTVMAVQDRLCEFAVLRTIGFSSSKIFGIIVAESMFLSLVGGLLGILGGCAILGWSDLAIGAEAVAVVIRPSLNLAWNGLVISIILGIFAGLAPALQAAYTNIVEALRHI